MAGNCIFATVGRFAYMAKRSFEEQAEDFVKRQLEQGAVQYVGKTEPLNEEIANALRKYPSKDGGSGGNIVDVKFMLEQSGRIIPVLIEVKGSRGDLKKSDANGGIEVFDKKGLLANAVKSKAVNGAVHYANAVVSGAKSFSEVIAVGANGYMHDGALRFECEAYYVSRENLSVPKLLGSYSDMSYFDKSNWKTILFDIDSIDVSPEERERKVREYETRFETYLKQINQTMQDSYQVSVSYRVQLLCGLIMAGLKPSAESALMPLSSSQLVSPAIDSKTTPRDDVRVLNQIHDFLTERGLPKEKIDIVEAHLSQALSENDLWKPIIDEGGKNTHESKIKLIYAEVEKTILPMFYDEIQPELKLDLTGKLFNVINDWVDIPDREKNDVVLTPRMVTDLMAKLCRVNCDSYVWDYAAGTAGFLVSSMRLMLEDAEKKFHSSRDRLEKKKTQIRYEQLLGIEKRQDMFVLAVLNMILMDDGSANILNKNSLDDYDGTYEQGEHKGDPFPATVFLLNPPYSAPGNGLIFAQRAMSRMKSGRAAVLIQETAGSGKAKEIASDILKHHSLIASIHMPDIFLGKSNVQTAIFVFEVGLPHNRDAYVRFVDFTNDGYTRTNRKKASSNANLKNTDHAVERYQEIVDFCLGYKKQSDLEFYSKEECFDGKISLTGDDWIVHQHKVIDPKPIAEDFYSVVSNYLSWELCEVIGGVSHD